MAWLFRRCFSPDVAARIVGTARLSLAKRVSASE
jgi:hypothetical protein